MKHIALILLLFFTFYLSPFTSKAQDFTFDGVKMLQPVSQFKTDLEAKGYVATASWYEGTEYWFSGVFLGRRPNYFNVRGYKDYVMEVNVAYSFASISEVDKFKQEAFELLKKTYPDFKARQDEYSYMLEGSTGTVSIYWGFKETFAGGDMMFPVEDVYVVSIFFQPKKKK